MGEIVSDADGVDAGKEFWLVGNARHRLPVDEDAR